MRYVLAIVALVNVVTFFVYGFDKRRSRRGGRRVPEANLLLLALFTGVIGAWLAMSVFRHKTQKTSFRLKLIAVTVLNGGWVALWWWLRAG